MFAAVCVLLFGGSAAAHAQSTLDGHIARLNPDAAPLASGLRAAIAPDLRSAKDLAIAGSAPARTRSATNAPFTFENTGSLNTARFGQTATLLPNGKVLVTGGFGNNDDEVTSAELYDPANGTWTATGSLHTAREAHTATLLPNGKVLVAAGDNNGSLSSAELYDPESGNWTATGSLNIAREHHTATLLPNGKVLVVGAPNGSVIAELYDPASGSWTATGSLHIARASHTATLLPDGKVLVAAGSNTFGAPYLSSAELYDPASGTWTVTGSLHTARSSHTATLLPNGKVLVEAGYNLDSGYLSSAELYDPASGIWTVTGNLNTARFGQTATLLPNGKVLVTGGFDVNVFISGAELYDPASGSWTATSSLNTAREFHTATLLPNGEVLVAGGSNGVGNLGSVELYDPVSETWTVTGSLHDARYDHTATLLPNGKVLVVGGVFLTGPMQGETLASAELYDPASGSWTFTGSLNTRRTQHTATLLANGKVLVAGGIEVGSDGYLSSAELYDTGLGFMPDWQPQITTASSPFFTDSRLTLSGSRFQGISQASGGGRPDSSTNYPIVQLRSIDNGQITYLLVDPIAGWSDTAFTSLPVVSFPPGPALVTVFTNGIPSDSKYLVEVSAPQVVSRKLHGGVPFEINLPLSGSPGIECRSGGVSNDHQVVFSFPLAVTFGSAAVTAGVGGSADLAGPPTISPDGTEVTVNLTNVSNAQRITVTLFGANYGFGAVDVAVPMGILLGDASGNGTVNASDLAKTKGQAGQPLTGSNFREDVNASGSINASDIGLVKSMSGTALPSNTEAEAVASKPRLVSSPDR